jgi:glutathione S-transferase
LLLAQLSIPFERIEYNLEDSESRTPQFLENVNPNGTIPVLEIEDGRFIPESNAILCYLAEGTRFISDDPFERAQTLRWMFFELESHAANIASPRYWITHGLEMTEERRASLEPKRTRGYSALGVMEDHLKDREFLI